MIPLPSDWFAFQVCSGTLLEGRFNFNSRPVPAQVSAACAPNSGLLLFCIAEATDLDEPGVLRGSLLVAVVGIEKRPRVVHVLTGSS